MICEPAETGSGAAVMLMPRSALAGVTLTVRMTALFDVIGSTGLVEATEARLKTWLPGVTVALSLATSVMVAVVPFAMGEIVAFRDLAEPPHVASGEEVQETNVSVPGRLSVIVTPFAVAGPLFVTLIVYVTSDPAAAWVGEAAIVIMRSAVLDTVTDAEAELLFGLGSATIEDTEPVLVIGPSAVVASTVATRVAVPEAAAARLGNATVRALPEP